MKLEEIINQKDKKITDIYFEAQTFLETKYGNNVVIFVEIGSFFEIYESNNIGKAREISKFLNIQLTKKNKNVDEVTDGNPLMCGMPSVTLDKYMDILLKEDIYTILIIRQTGTPPNIIRVIDKIVSPGTNIDNINSHNNNYIASIFIEKNKKNSIIIGSVSYIDLSTGEVKLYETYGSEKDKELPLDEIFSLNSIYSSNEYILTLSGFKEENEENSEYIDKKLKSDIDDIKNKLGLLTKKGIVNHLEDKTIEKSLKIDYQNSVLKSIYSFNSMLTPIEYFNLEKHVNTVTSFILNIEFIVEHNMNIIKSLKYPDVLNSGKYMYLGNNALDQLEIIDDNGGLVSIITKGCTPYGKRFIRQRLLNPIVNTKEIQERYNNSELFIDKELIYNIREALKGMYDIERLNRRIEIESIHPYEMSNYYSSLESFMSIYEKFYENKKFHKMAVYKELNITNIIKVFKKMKSLFNIDEMSKYNSNNVLSSFINNNKNIELDKLIENRDDEYIILKKIAKHISKYIKDDGEEYVKINLTEKEGYTLSLTKNRYDLIKDKLKTLNLKLGKETLTIDFKNRDKIKYMIKTGTVKIHGEYFSTISDKITVLDNKIIKETMRIFSNFVKDFMSKYQKDLNYLIMFLGEIEFYITNANLKLKYEYNIPKIIETKEESFIEAVEIRHPIIERIEEHGIYIPNNVAIGNKKYIKEVSSFNEIYQEDKSEDIKGTMLYGINSSGKSSLMKSVGISLIMAQSGFFVPAKSFRYAIYNSIFTRISGKDNLYQGLSTFAVEMLELRNIFNRVSDKSLVLGDEISHGTETISGMSIVASTVINLIEKNSHFIFATHLHQLNDLEDIKKLTNMVNLHLSVHYDEDKDRLIYDRTLKAGSGSSVYGLEFAKYLKLDSDFLKIANKIRMTIASDLENIELLTKQNRSGYNKKLLITKCLICGAPASETHHIKEQQTADKRGIIDHHHKNHQYNVVPICNKHHKMCHSGKLNIKGYLKTSNGIELDYDFNEL